MASRHQILSFANLLIVACGLFCCTQSASAQKVPEYGRYQPLWQNSPPGTAARWAQLTGKLDPNYFQPIRIINEEAGDVTLFHRRPVQQSEHKSPAQLSVIAGHSYRFKISNMRTFPGIELFPTIEVIDRLHPPTGEKHNYPIPIHISREDVDAVLAGKLVTHIVYLEQPQFAAPFELDKATRARQLKPRENAVEMADRLGRPMVILRIGGRLPSVHGEPVTFWGTGGPVAKSQMTQQAAIPVPTNGALNSDEKNSDDTTVGDGK